MKIKQMFLLMSVDHLLMPRPGFEPRTSRTLDEYHTPIPTRLGNQNFLFKINRELIGNKKLGGRKNCISMLSTLTALSPKKSIGYKK